jgi:AraC-like DNA-binding protein
MKGDPKGQSASVNRVPSPPLRPFIKLLWASDEKRPHGLVQVKRERLLPSGGMHLVFRLSEDPIRIFDSVEDYSGHSFNRGVVGGIRAGFYVKEISKSARTVGAMVQPGVSEFLFGVKADELSERHTSIEDLWGHEAKLLWEQLQYQGTLHGQLDVFELFLAKRLPQMRGIHPAIAHALNRLPLTNDIGKIVDETGYSHRRFIELFRRTVGLPPRLYTRVLRFQRAFKLVAGKPPASWADLAIEAGYSDQAHFNREFREFSGVSPTQYLSVCTGDSLHVPILPRNP